MANSPPDDYPQVMPFVYYEDPGAALDWLIEAFGMREKMRLTLPSGDVLHAEGEFDHGGVIMLGRPSEDYRSPRDEGPVHQLISVYVEDVDAHHEHARAAGARIVRELETADYGDRTYLVADLEGHHWGFSQRVRDVSLEEIQQQISGGQAT